jgi:O-succinylbenzoate synthase
MRIDKIDAYVVRLPLKKELRLADMPHQYIDSVFVRMESGEYSGWGEVMPGNEPVLTAAWSNSVFLCLKDSLIPRVGKAGNIDSGKDLEQAVQQIRGNRHAKGILDMAWWDLYARVQQKPLHTILGGTRQQIVLGLIFDRMDSPEEFFAELHRAENDGFRRVTLKIRPGWDINMLSAVRTEFPQMMIQCDVEGALSLNSHSDTIYRFDDFFPTVLEQPLSSKEYVGHAMLQDSLRTPIGLDESVTSYHEAEIVIDLRSASVICLNAGRIGGLTTAKAVHDLCLAGEIICYSGMTFLSSVGYRHVAALAALPNCQLPVDYIRAEEIFEVDPGQPLTTKVIDLSENELDYEIKSYPDARVAELWNEPGIGFDPDMSLIEKYAVEHVEWKA